MRRKRAVIGCTAYLLCLTAMAATTADGGSYGAWFFGSGVDWHSAQGAALTALIGGGLRTLRTLFSARPTLRVAMEAVGDAGLAVVTAAVLFIGLVAYASVFSPLPHALAFVILVAGGYMRGGVLDAVDEGSKRLLAAATDGAVSWVQRRMGASPQDPPASPPT